MSDTIYLRDLRKSIEDEVGLSRQSANEVLKVLRVQVVEALASGRKVVFTDLGTFETTEYAPRRFYDCVRKELSELSARRVATFRPGRSLVKALRDGK